MASMRFLTEDQIREIQAELVAAELADDAERLCRRARSAGCVVEITSIADTFGVVSVRPRDVHSAARGLAVPA
jgi:hypothetical protein